MEKFALFNLLKALQSFSPQNNKDAESADSPENDSVISAKTSAAAEEKFTRPNVMASVLERHEAISNRIKNKN